MICGEEFSDHQCLRITSIEASKITNVYFYLESEVVLPTSNDVVSAKISRRFEQLEKKLTKLKALHVRWIDSKPETCRFSVEHYSNLEYLQLEGCPPSLIIGSFHHHFSRLKKLDIYGSDGLSLSRLFLPWRDKKIQCDFPPMTPYFECKEVPDVNKSWSSLSMVRLSKCGLVVLDNSLHYLPKLTEIDFSQNSISEIVHLQDCSKLTKLNLSINKIRVLSNISRVLGNISSLNIANNQVESLDGVQGLYALRTFDVSGNLIVDFQEIHHLNRLPCLESLTLIGNPISLPKMGGGKIPGGETNEIGLMLYRRLVFKNLITDRFIAGAVKSLPLLDDKPISPAQQQSFSGLVLQNLDTDYSESSHPPVDASDFILANLNDLRRTWNDSRQNSPVSFTRFSRANSPTSTARRDSDGSTAGCSRNNSPKLFKNISTTWNFSRNSSPVAERNIFFPDDYVVDEIGRRRRDTDIVRMERELEKECEEILTLEKLKRNLIIARRKPSISV